MAQQSANGVNPFNYQSVKKVVVQNGAVASACPIASEVGVMVLKKGGNAIDAAVAVQFALAVTYPRAGNIGGGGFLVAHLAGGENIGIDYREQAPGKAKRYMFVRNGKSDGDLRTKGHLAAAIPTTVAGIFLAHEKYGRLPMEQLIQPAIDLARYGFALSESEAKSYNANEEAFITYNTKPSAFVKDGIWKKGDTLLQPDLARTLELIRDKGPAGFYEGETARKIVDEMKRGGGIISESDLKYAQKSGAVFRDPIVFDYRGHRIVSMAPSSSGGIALQQMLGMLRHYPIEKYGLNTIESVHLMTEIERRMFSDRAAYITDPDFVKMPLDSIVTPHYLKERIADYTFGKMTPQADIKSLTKFHVESNESSETTHISILDKEGNAVSVTYTLSSNYGNKVVVGGAGFFLNNEMRAFAYNPRKGSIVNTIQPYIRMRSSMAPTVVLKDDKPWIVLGTPGSETIITSIFQTIVNMVDFNMSAMDAVNAPKFHWNNSSKEILMERRFPRTVADSLASMGYKLKKNRTIGRMEVIQVTREGIEAVADFRGNDSAAGY